MGIFDQIRQDAIYLKNLISSLRSDSGSMTVFSNGVRLTGDALEQALATARSSNQAELTRLELILESGVIPDKYYSIITKQTYHPSSEEIKQKTTRLPAAKYTFFTAKKSRSSEENLSRFTLYSDSATPLFSFYVEHNNKKDYPRGSYVAKVKKGFIDKENLDKPKYALKVFHEDMFNGETMHELRIAMRAAYCYKQLGREAYAFRSKKKQYILTEWLSGATLDTANEEQIKSIPIARRIVMAISLICELNVLHKQNLLHNNIKPGKVMVNYGRLHFTDLNSIRPKGEKPLFGVTPIFTSQYLPSPQMSFDAQHNPKNLYKNFDEKTDIYALGLTLTKLFPEIYMLKDEDVEIKVNGGPPDTYIFKTFSLVHGIQHDQHPELQMLLKNIVLQYQSTFSTLSSTVDLINAFTAVLSLYPDYSKYIDEDSIVHLEDRLTPSDAEKGFREIEIELLGYNQRSDMVYKNRP